jgi:hypothetical protein
MDSRLAAWALDGAVNAVMTIAEAATVAVAVRRRMMTRVMHVSLSPEGGTRRCGHVNLNRAYRRDHDRERSRQIEFWTGDPGLTGGAQSAPCQLPPALPIGRQAFWARTGRASRY